MFCSILLVKVCKSNIRKLLLIRGIKEVTYWVYGFIILILNSKYIKKLFNIS